MSGIATAVIGAAVIGGVATSVAGSKEASATQSATNTAVGEQEWALNQQTALSKPYRDLGTANIPTYQKLLAGGPGAEQTLESLPGYQTAMTQGTEAAKRASAASGLNLSGNQVAGVEQFGAQLGDATYQTELANLLQPINLGQAAAAGQAANVGTTASNIGNLAVAQGSTNAAIDANEAASLTKLAGNAANQGLTYSTLAGLNNQTVPPAAAPNFDGSVSPAPTYNAPTPGFS